MYARLRPGRASHGADSEHSGGSQPAAAAFKLEMPRSRFKSRASRSNFSSFPGPARAVTVIKWHPWQGMIQVPCRSGVGGLTPTFKFQSRKAQPLSGLSPSHALHLRVSQWALAGVKPEKFNHSLFLRQSECTQFCPRPGPGTGMSTCLDMKSYHCDVVIAIWYDFASGHQGGSFK